MQTAVRPSRHEPHLLRFNRRASTALALVGVFLLAPRPQLFAAEPDHSKVPGVVIAHSPASSGIYLGSPGIARLSNGDYLAKCDEFGPGSTEHTQAVTRVYRSSDRGRTWQHVTNVTGLFWASVFEHRGVAYLMGTDKHNGHTVILKSTDHGSTWSTPRDRKTGLLFDDGKYHCAPVPVVVHRGRLWRAMEDAMGPGGWGAHFRAFMMSIPEDADLLDAANWTCSNRLGLDPTWLDGQFGGWLEGNAAVTPDGQVVDVLRVDYRPQGGTAAMIRISDDGKAASFDPVTGFIAFPGGCKKFTIRFDPVSQCYWSLSNWVPKRHAGKNPERTRNTVALVASQDLRHWDVRCAVLYHPDVQKHGFQYLDWQFEGEDLIVASRTAFDDGLGGAHNQHDANYLTFHRIRNFRNLTPAESTPDLLDQVLPSDRPRVLILGDSISIGYTPFVRRLLADEAVVVRPMQAASQPEKCEGTTKGVRELDRWLNLGGGRWDVIHFNFGLHDLKHVVPGTSQNSNDPAHPRQAEPSRYERQLRQIVERLQQTGARLIFATTTPVPPGDVRPYRDAADPARYNKIAVQIMREHGISVNDLCPFAEARLAEIQQPADVHFTPAGSETLAKEVVRQIRQELSKATQRQ